MKKIIERIKIGFSKIKKDYPVLLFYIIANIINAILLGIFSTGNFSIRALLFNIGYVLIMGSFSFLIKKKNRNIYYFLTSFYMIACCVVNVMYYNYYSSFVSV